MSYLRESTQERCEVVTTILSLSAIFTDARLVEVSTSPSMSRLHDCTPWGALYSAMTRLREVAVSIVKSGLSTLSRLSLSVVSRPLYSFSMSAAYLLNAMRTSSLREVCTPNTTCAARGIALRRLPPSISATHTSSWACIRLKRKREMILLALARPRWMSPPEWPPRPSRTSRLK